MSIAANNPNVLLITLDTLRADMVGCYGYRGNITPHLDRLAAAGVRFEQAITGGSWTQAAFPTILTSTPASLYGGCLGPLSPARPSPVAALADAGYATGAFSTSPLLSRNYGYDRGFDTFEDLVPQEKELFLRRQKGGQRLLRSPLTHYLLRMLGVSSRPARLYVSGEEVTGRAQRWLETVRKPFFAWIHYMDVHWPYHREDCLTQPREVAQAWHDLWHMHGVNWRGRSITPQQRDHYFRLYEQAVQYTDDQVGRLLDVLAQLEHLSDTIVILVSDHGEEFLERRQWGHFETNLHDEILKVPLIVAGPGVPAGRVVRRQVSTLDIMPTILALCGVPPLPEMEGESLVPLWNETAGDYTADMAIGEMWRDHHHIIAVRTDSFKYIWDSKQPDQPRLYNLQTDPGEQHNVAGRYPRQVSRFQQVVDSHLQRAAEQGMEEISRPEADAELLRRLRDLGYVE